MTKEELKEHCKKQVRMCEVWANSKGEKPGGKVYEEHKLILELLEQEPKTGRWITLKDKYDDVVEAVCSCCDKNGNHKWTYCPNCGCHMIEP